MEIRAQHKDCEEEVFCPLTAISYNETKIIHPSEDAHQDKVNIGFPLELWERTQIIFASDNSIDQLNGAEEKVIRKTMLRILGLDKEKNS
jgi:hypothetical protein